MRMCRPMLAVWARTSKTNQASCTQHSLRAVGERNRWLGCLVLCSTLAALGCATVRPEQRAILADPTMQYDDNDQPEAARQHVLENREASFGGGSVRGGGCGCN